jgi:putative endonuclease
MAWVYILQSVRDGRFYIGSTADIESRLHHHECGATPSTKRFGGVKEVFRQEYPTLELARRVEQKLKKLKRRDYIEKVVDEGRIRMDA